MQYSVVIERITDGSLPAEYFYAHVPALDLTTHGLGIEGAQMAAKELIEIWIAEKIENGDPVPIEKDSFFSRIEIENTVLST